MKLKNLISEKQLTYLWKGKYGSIAHLPKYPYEAFHEPDTVMIFPIKQNGKIGIRKELCPAYLIKDTNEEDRLFYTVITGKVENNENLLHTAYRELREETGIKIKDAKILFEKKQIPVCKSMSMRNTLFILLLKEYETESPTGDGSVYEEKSESIWVTINELKQIINDNDNIDHLLLLCYYLLKDLDLFKK